jgi:hypothetical protein
LKIASDSDVHESTGDSIDLALPALEDVSKSLPLVKVAARAGFRYEGTLQNARLYVTKGVKRYLSIFFLAFRAYISEVRPKSPIKIEYFSNFETCCGKRFQELFPEHTEGRDSAFITRWFGGSNYKTFLETLRIGEYSANAPKISDQGKKTFWSLSQSTAKPYLWPEIREAMFNASPRGAFYPDYMSASSDVILTACEKGSDGRDHQVTIGLAVKCLQGPLSEPLISAEKQIFNQMFESKSVLLTRTRKSVTGAPASTPPLPRGRATSNDVDGRVRRTDDVETDAKSTETDDVNILIICNTGTYSYPKFAANEFSFVEGPHESYPFIHETIYLNLSNEKMRSDFFGIRGAEDIRLRENLEFLVKKGRDKSPSQRNTKQN